MSESYYHGGVRGLRVGDLLLPPTETGAPHCADFAPADLDASHIRRDRVYLARNQRDAAVYAGMQPGGGDLYEAEPIGEVEPDADYIGDEPGYSVQVTAARVVRVVDRGVRVQASLDEIRTWLAQTNHNQVKRATKVRRNEPCPCGSGAKYKRCCGSAVRVA